MVYMYSGMYSIVLNSRPGVYFLPEVLDLALRGLQFCNYIFSFVVPFLLQSTCMYMFCPNQEPCPVPEPDNIAAQFRNRLPGSRTGCPVRELDKHISVQGQGLGFRFRIQGSRQVTIIVIWFQNRTAGSQTGCLVLELDKILDWDRTYTNVLTGLQHSAQHKVAKYMRDWQ